MYETYLLKTHVLPNLFFEGLLIWTFGRSESRTEKLIKGEVNEFDFGKHRKERMSLTNNSSNKNKNFSQFNMNSISKCLAILIPRKSPEFDVITWKKTQSTIDCLSTRSKLGWANNRGIPLYPEKYPEHRISQALVRFDRRKTVGQLSNPRYSTTGDFQCCRRNINPLSDNYICIEPRHACFTRICPDVPFANPRPAFLSSRLGNCNRARGQSISRNNSIKSGPPFWTGKTRSFSALSSLPTPVPTPILLPQSVEKFAFTTLVRVLPAIRDR